MRNKIFIFSAVILFGIIVSYVVFSWSEPTGNMPSSYKTPINTSIETQDVAAGKPVIGNLNVEKLGGYSVSDILALIGGNQPASYQIVEGTSCPTGTILTSKYYAKKTCTYDYAYCEQMKDANGNYVEGCQTVIRPYNITVGPGWALDPSSKSAWIMSWMSCSPAWATNSGTFYCSSSNYQQYQATCQAPITHVLCLTIDTP